MISPPSEKTKSSDGLNLKYLEKILTPYKKESGYLPGYVMTNCYHFYCYQAKKNTTYENRQTQCFYEFHSGIGNFSKWRTDMKRNKNTYFYHAFGSFAPIKIMKKFINLIYKYFGIKIIFKSFDSYAELIVALEKYTNKKDFSTISRLEHIANCISEEKLSPKYFHLLRISMKTVKSQTVMRYCLDLVRLCWEGTNWMFLSTITNKELKNIKTLGEFITALREKYLINNVSRISTFLFNNFKGGVHSGHGKEALMYDITTPEFNDAMSPDDPYVFSTQRITDVIAIAKRAQYEKTSEINKADPF